MATIAKYRMALLTGAAPGTGRNRPATRPQIGPRKIIVRLRARMDGRVAGFFT